MASTSRTRKAGLQRLAPSALIAAIAVAAAPATSNAATFPTGHAKGVRVSLTKRTVTFSFGRYTSFDVRYLVEGRRSELSCTWLQSMRLDGFRPWYGYNDRLRAPRHVHTLRLRRPFGQMPSFCSIWQVRPVHRPLVDIPMTQDGATYLDERKTMFALTDAAGNASMDAKDAGVDTFPTNAQLVDEYSHSNSGTAAALASPDATPPPGKLGVFSDGAHHFEAVKLTTPGRRLFYDLNDGVLTTNGQTYLYANAA
jgi:hypothetical protein